MKIYESIKEADYDNDSGKGFWGNVGGGVLPIALSTKRFLVPYRSAHVNEPHTWGVIGGKVDNEAEMDIQGEVRREFEEETGFHGSIKLIPAFVFKTDGFEYHNFIGILPDEFEPKTDWETERFEWMTFDELMNINPKHFGLKGLLKNSIGLIKKYSGNI